MLEAYDLQLASAAGAPAMERCLLRWIENVLRLPVWVPVVLPLYVQLDAAVAVAVDSLHSAKQRESLMKLTTSKADAMQVRRSEPLGRGGCSHREPPQRVPPRPCAPSVRSARHSRDCAALRRALRCSGCARSCRTCPSRRT